jgi:tetratricopeptide (TPR) repeat protein
MGMKKSKPTQVVVMSSSKRFASRKVVGLSLVAILLLAAAVLASLVLFNKDDTDTATDKPKTAAEAVEVSDKLKYSKDAKEAAGVSAEAFNDSDNKEDKYMLALQTASIYQFNKDYTSAIEWYLKADALKPDLRGSLVGLASCYEAAGQKDKAIDYYKKVVALKDSTGQGVQNDTAYYQYKLDKLTGEKQ